MQIDERAVGEVTILDLKGKITLNEGDEVLKDKINSLIMQGKKKILLNLADVPYIDSAGLGEIVRTYTTVSRQGGQLKLVNLTKRITDLLMITKLLTVFETFEVEQDAIKSYSERFFRVAGSSESIDVTALRRVPVVAPVVAKATAGRPVWREGPFVQVAVRQQKSCCRFVRPSGPRISSCSAA